MASLLTVQTTTGLRSVHPVSPGLISSQATAVLEDERVRAIKIGALGTTEAILEVAELIRSLDQSVPVVFDPVMSPTRGRDGLLPSRAIDALGELLPLCTLITPNAPEASTLTGIEVRDALSARQAIDALLALGPRAVLLKGGHLTGPQSTDWLAVGGDLTELKTNRIAVRPFHGGGCTLASLIASGLAQNERHPVTDRDLLNAVRFAKKKISAILKEAVPVGEGLLVLPLGLARR